MGGREWPGDPKSLAGATPTLSADRAAEFPKVFTRAVIEYFITGHNLEEAAVVRAIELSAIRYCPAQAMLVKVFPIESIYHIFEDEGEGQSRLVKSGAYVPVEETGVD